jgi:hypothetical protein
LKEACSGKPFAEETTKEKAMLVQPRTDWMRNTAPLGFLVGLLGAWVFFVPLVGPYFDFGFDTDETWVFSDTHWTLSLVPGLVALAGGLLLMLPGSNRRLGVLLALAAGGWLVIGPSLLPLWESGELGPVGGSEGKQALLWIAYFYGAGALAILLAGLSLGLAQRWRGREFGEEVPAEPEEVEFRPARDVEPEPAAERTVVYR